MAQSPPVGDRRSQARSFVRIVACGLLAVLLGGSREATAGATMAGEDEPPVVVRVTWGGGKPRAWSGVIEVVPSRDRPAGSPSRSPGVVWSWLGQEPDSATTMHAETNRLMVHEWRSQSANGADVHLKDGLEGRLRARLSAAEGGGQLDIDLPLADLLDGPVQSAADAMGNRLTVALAPGEMLAVRIEAEVTSVDRARPLHGGPWLPGETLRMTVFPRLPGRVGGLSGMQLRMRQESAGSGAAGPEQVVALQELPAVAGDTDTVGLEPAMFRIRLPDRDGVVTIVLELMETGGLRWSRMVASRRLELLVVDDRPLLEAAETAGDGASAWRMLYELDPGSPRLHERLRRLSGLAVAAVPSLDRLPRPSLPLPSLSMPGLPRPSFPLPKLPGGLDADDLIPRLGGLVGSGSSSVEPHTLGPMLRLPPAGAEPSWEAISLAGAPPGSPHRVEIRFPTDQSALVAALVVESAGSGAPLRVRAATGIHAVGGQESQKSGLGTHRFVFWPTTKAPLLLLVNLSSRRPALLGTISVSVATQLSASAPSPAAPEARQVFAAFASPDFRSWGEVGSSREAAGWEAWYQGMDRATEWLVSQRRSGALVEVYAEGGGLVPSKVTGNAPRWEPRGAVAELSSERKNGVALLCRLFTRRRLRLVAAMRFDGGLPAVEAALASDASSGLLLRGRDGQPRDPAATTGGRHYNILDPRVQVAVLEVVRELAESMRQEPAVAGLAVTMPASGWLHLPGVAWGLDDETFGRFAATIGLTGPLVLPGSYGERAAAVEGPLRERWLAWRSDVMAGFHRQLVAVMAAAGNPAWKLYVTPTDLFAAGEIAARFLPALPGPVEDADLLRECGFDPAATRDLTQLVYCLPGVHTASDDLAVATQLVRINSSPGLLAGFGRAGRCGLMLFEKPVSVPCQEILPRLGLEGEAVPVRAVPLAVGEESLAIMARGVAAADPDVIFATGVPSEMGPETAAACAAFERLPSGAHRELADTPDWLVARCWSEGGKTTIALVNTSPAASRLTIDFPSRPEIFFDAGTGERFASFAGQQFSVTLPGWGLRVMVAEGTGADLPLVTATHDEEVVASLQRQVAELRRRQIVLEAPKPLAVLDNPGFDLPAVSTGVTGWEIVQPSGGTLQLVPHEADPGGIEPRSPQNRSCLRLVSVDDVTTLRSNPFPPPTTGNASIAVRLRLAAGAEQPPLRVALEGSGSESSAYRFAPVGAAAGGRPLGTAWTRFVLQVNDVPASTGESLRVRFDMLGPGQVDIDQVEIFDIVIDEARREQIGRMLERIDRQLAAGSVADVAGELAAYWPRFLLEGVSDETVEAAERRQLKQAEAQARRRERAAQAAPSESLFDRFKGWWR